MRARVWSAGKATSARAGAARVGKRTNRAPRVQGKASNMAAIAGLFELVVVAMVAIACVYYGTIAIGLTLAALFKALFK
jgi:hypothetical protein